MNAPESDFVIALIRRGIVWESFDVPTIMKRTQLIFVSMTLLYTMQFT
jgi:hypothetical protein